MPEQSTFLTIFGRVVEDLKVSSPSLPTSSLLHPRHQIVSIASLPFFSKSCSDFRLLRRIQLNAQRAPPTIGELCLLVKHFTIVKCCANCLEMKSESAMRLCSGCELVEHCSASCSASHAEHKEVCGLLREARRVLPFVDIVNSTVQLRSELSILAATSTSQPVRLA